MRVLMCASVYPYYREFTGSGFYQFERLSLVLKMSEATKQMFLSEDHLLEKSDEVENFEISAKNSLFFAYNLNFVLAGKFKNKLKIS